MVFNVNAVSILGFQEIQQLVSRWYVQNASHHIGINQDNQKTKSLSVGKRKEN
jgi:hypothetical protein